MDLPMTKADDDAVRDQMVGCLRDAGDKLCSDAADEIERLRAQLAAAEANAEHGWHCAGTEQEARLTAESQLQTMRKALNEIAPAVESLACHQEQCDEDGIMVVVSRQAVDEVTNAINEMAIGPLRSLTEGAGKVMDPTARGDIIAEKVRAWYEANRESWWDRHKPGIWGRAPDRAGVHADNFMLRFINAVIRADEETPR